MADSPKRRISYFMDTDIGSIFYGEDHPMKPHRLSMTHNLCLAYGLYRRMDVYRPRRATPEELRQFHSAEYVDFLQRVTPDNANDFKKQIDIFNVGKSGDDCPLFDGLYEFCQTYTGGSIDGAKRIMSGATDIAINWAGGLHHAKKSEASGFCFVNDIVLAILELLKYFPRVLYIDIDVHHGDGVEEAFYITDRVMTASFHQFGDGFFPGTGDVWDKGSGAGEYYSVNCPLKEGMDDESFEGIFQPVICKIMQIFRPEAVVLQCGADSLAGDRLGRFNLTIEGHAKDYWEYFGPDFNLQIAKTNMENRNSWEYLVKLREKVLENLGRLTAAPSVQMQEVPSTYYPSDDDEDVNPDFHPVVDKASAPGEFYDGDRDHGMNGIAPNGVMS